MMLFWIKRLIKEAYDRGYDLGIGQGYRLGFQQGKLEARKELLSPKQSLSLLQAEAILWRKESREGEL